MVYNNAENALEPAKARIQPSDTRSRQKGNGWAAHGRIHARRIWRQPHHAAGTGKAVIRGKKSRAVCAQGDAPEGGKQWQSWPNQLVIGYPQPSSLFPSNARSRWRTPLTCATRLRASTKWRTLRKRNVERRGSGYSLPQSDTEWNFKSPNSGICHVARLPGSGIWTVWQWTGGRPLQPVHRRSSAPGCAVQFEEIWTKAATLVSTTGRVLNGATWSLAGRGQRS